VIPSNDDAIRAIKLMVAKMADAVEEGKAIRKDEQIEAEATMRPGEAEAEAARLGRTSGMEDELEDAKLLGESTLAKLAPVLKMEEIEEIIETADIEAAEIEPADIEAADIETADIEEDDEQEK